MTFAKDSPLVSRVVPTASTEQGARPGGAADIRGITIHMAEGGGTVSWLTRADGNSSHYVVEYTGALVQMVQETHWAGSINPSLLRKDNDAAYTYLGSACTYGRTAAVAALGTTAANDPNRYVIAIETEGYAKDGPNAKQRATLAKLVNDIRRRRGAKPTLGHRDFQSYKACPGHKIPWIDYGGHAKKVAYQASPTPTPTPPPVPQPGDTDMPAFKTYATPKLMPVPKGGWLYVKPDLSADINNVSLDPGRDLPVSGVLADGLTHIVGYRDTTPTEPIVPTYYVKGTVKDYPVATAPAPVDATACKPFTDPLTTRIALLEADVANAGLKGRQAEYDRQAAGATIKVELLPRP